MKPTSWCHVRYCMSSRASVCFLACSAQNSSPVSSYMYQRVPAKNPLTQSDAGTNTTSPFWNEDGMRIVSPASDASSRSRVWISAFAMLSLMILLPEEQKIPETSTAAEAAAMEIAFGRMVSSVSGEVNTRLLQARRPSRIQGWHQTLSGHG